MKKSARQLGDMLGKTAQEVNLLLKEHGYLDGTPGDYYVTEKGTSYAEERFKDKIIHKISVKEAIKNAEKAINDALAL